MYAPLPLIPVWAMTRPKTPVLYPGNANCSPLRPILRRADDVKHARNVSFACGELIQRALRPKKGKFEKESTPVVPDCVHEGKACFACEEFIEPGDLRGGGCTGRVPVQI